MAAAINFRVVSSAGQPQQSLWDSFLWCPVASGHGFCWRMRGMEGLCPQRARVTPGTATSPRDDSSSLSILLKSCFKMSTRSFPCLPYFASGSCVPSLPFSFSPLEDVSCSLLSLFPSWGCVPFPAFPISLLEDLSVSLLSSFPFGSSVPFPALPFSLLKDLSLSLLSLFPFWRICPFSFFPSFLFGGAVP